MKNPITTCTLVAVGGNALLRAHQHGTVAEQRANAAITAQHLVRLIQQGHQLILTHGNGPQVGAQLLRSEMAADQVSPEPLDLCVADTEGAIGYILEQALRDALAVAQIPRSIATVITQVVVDPHDPAFRHPSKPVGPFYSAAEARQRAEELGWQLVEDAARGYRRVVPSPEPLEIVEVDVIQSLLRDGYIVIAAGGGGIPVVRCNGKLVGVEAVVDKDSASALLAHELHLTTVIIATDTEYVYLNYKLPNQQALCHLTSTEAQAHLAAGHFPPGNMGPKIAAAIRFLRDGGQEVIITAPKHLTDAMLGQTGTHIYAERNADHAITQ